MRSPGEGLAMQPIVMLIVLWLSSRGCEGDCDYNIYLAE